MGKWYTLPFDLDLPRIKSKCKLPNVVSMAIDEQDFKPLLQANATWVQGNGPFVLLAYCGELTISRHETLESAVHWKRALDGGGCGGRCVGVHIIAPV